MFILSKYIRCKNKGNAMMYVNEMRYNRPSSVCYPNSNVVLFLASSPTAEILSLSPEIKIYNINTHKLFNAFLK